MAAGKKVSGPGSDDVFVWESELGEVRLPSLAKVPVGVMRRIRKLTPADQTFTLVEELADEGALAVIDQMGADEFNPMMQAWRDHSGVSEGE